MPPDPAVVEYWSDLHCPYAYLVRYRLRKLEAEYEGRVRFVPRALAIELDTRRPTPRGILDAETPLLMLLEPGIPYRGWHGMRADHWPVTVLPAFEAMHCARRQGEDLAWDMDWRIRRAFFENHRCISMRHELVDVARDVPGLDVDRFEADWDSGTTKGDVIRETREGWYERDYDVSPVLALPDGSAHENPGGQYVGMDEDRGWAVTEFRRGAEDALGVLRALLDRAVATAKR